LIDGVKSPLKHEKNQNLQRKAQGKNGTARGDNGLQKKPPSSHSKGGENRGGTRKGGVEDRKKKKSDPDGAVVIKNRQSEGRDRVETWGGTHYSAGMPEERSGPGGSTW